MFIKVKDENYVNVNAISWIWTTLQDWLECLQISFIWWEIQTISYKHISDRDEVFKNILVTKNWIVTKL